MSKGLGYYVGKYVSLAWSLFVLVQEVVFAVLGIELRRSFRDVVEHMDASTDYAEWKSAARKLDEVDGYLSWRVDENTRQYNFCDVSKRIKQLSELKRAGNTAKLLEVLQSDIHRSTFGITNPLLYQFRTGTKTAIRSYVNLLEYIVRSLPSATDVSAGARAAVLSEISEAYGNSALVLNGSIALGGYHLGVVKALHDANLLPRVLFGCNTGAIVAACLCCLPNVSAVLDASTINFAAFQKRSARGSIQRKLQRFFKDGVLMDTGTLLAFVEDNLKDVTFLEAFRATGRVLNIHVGRYLGASQGNASWLLNYLTAPHVVVSSAAVASCATPGVYAETLLMAKTLDGRIVPFDPSALNFAHGLRSPHVNDAVNRMRELFNVKLFIVSECSISQMPAFQLSHCKSSLASIARFFTEEAWRFLAFASRLKPFRSRLTGVLLAMTEPVRGDVVIYPASRWSDLLVLLRNPDQQLLQHCLQRGQVELWPSLEQIRTHVSVEIAIHDALSEIQHEAL